MLLDVDVGGGALDVLDVVLDEAVVGLVVVSGGDVAAGRLANGTPSVELATRKCRWLAGRQPAAADR